VEAVVVVLVVAVARAVEAEEAFAVVVLPAVLTLAAASTALAISGADVSAVALSTAVAFVVAVLAGATGVATGAITDSLMISSSAATAFRGGGAGTIPTDITVTTITRTITMDTAGTRTATTVAAVTDTAMAADQGIFGVSGGGDKPVRLFEIASPLVRVDQVNLGRTKSNQTQRKNNMPKNGSTKTAEVRQRRDLPAVCRCVEN
jgi:hypothetical protein